MDQPGRRKFIFKSALLAAGFPFLGSYLTSCQPTKLKSIKGSLAGPSSKAGHLLRTGISIVSEDIEEAEVVIIGGGVAGLAANRWLHQNSGKKVVLLELEDQTGGNAAAGKNEHTAFPWGAHYLTLPNNNLTELLNFLKEEGVITGYDEKGLPIYNEYYLCFDPEERLFINGYWQQGLIPNWGVPEPELKEIERFLARMEIFRWAKGSDEKYAFAIPITTSSSDEFYRRLDKVRMQEWLQQENFTSPHLRWYLNYCCLDDYGSRLEDTSAWAGIHYFAARKATGANTDSDRVLTWPEGNNWLTNRLRKIGEENIRTNSLAYKISFLHDRVAIDYRNVTTNQVHRLLARQCILATPQFVNERLLSNLPLKEPRPVNDFTYSTWLVANITVKQLPLGRGTPLCWDNVIYGSPALGYVYANHQQVQLYPPKQTITFYYPLTGQDLRKVRGEAYQKSKEYWQDLVVTELEKPHPNIRSQVETLDSWIWGHGMIRPTVGFIWGEQREKATQSIQNKIFFAHSDLSGISVFEEAFYQGINAAQQILERNQDA
ncbi:NAD(P)/FAD-dependent oxidoreductase [Adhaeribacter arboris]|uniref:NAD(P)/FAD-dependent oxidoreductase n=1 Tax=Adhaeribacter arboris TaxID=2072846 RepID=UPI001304D8B3|nr:NAD(P)/FAD-dependent oxidoreductase [Adhaeribacter arboris]